MWGYGEQKFSIIVVNMLIIINIIIVVVVVVVVVVRCLSFWSSFFHLLLVAYCIFAEHLYLLVLADGWCGCDVCK